MISIFLNLLKCILWPRNIVLYELSNPLVLFIYLFIRGNKIGKMLTFISSVIVKISITERFLKLL